MIIKDLLLPCVIVAIIFVVLLTEQIKKLDKNNKLRGKKVFIPLLLSCLFSLALGIGDFFPLKQVFFYGAAIFTVSVTYYETILKKTKLDNNHDDLAKENT